MRKIFTYWGVAIQDRRGALSNSTTQWRNGLDLVERSIKDNVDVIDLILSLPDWTTEDGHTDWCTANQWHFIRLQKHQHDEFNKVSSSTAQKVFKRINARGSKFCLVESYYCTSLTPR
jgi:hypothetical protein